MKRTSRYAIRPGTDAIKGAVRAYRGFAEEWVLVRAGFGIGADTWELYREDGDEAFLEALTDDVEWARYHVRASDPDTELQLSIASGGETILTLQLSDSAQIDKVFGPLDATAGRTAPPARAGSPCVFVGHGRNQLWRQLADHLRDHHDIPVVTYESQARAGIPHIEVLEKLQRKASFAILVHTIEHRDADGAGRAGENVIYESGLFQQKLGSRCALIVREEGCTSFANVEGLNHLVFSEGRINEVFGEVVAAIRREHPNQAA